MSAPPESITCVECGGTAYIISYLPPEEELEEGGVYAYRCAECMERFDMVWEDSE